jgi:predicted metal-dependent RNase
MLSHHHASLLPAAAAAAAALMLTLHYTLRFLQHCRPPPAAVFLTLGDVVREFCPLSGGCRFPDFSLLSPSGDFTSAIDAVFISHFHLDHVGALPYFTEVRNKEHSTV